MRVLRRLRGLGLKFSGRQDASSEHVGLCQN